MQATLVPMQPFERHEQMASERITFNLIQIEDNPP